MNNEEEIMKEVNKLFVTMANVHIDGKPMADLLKLYNSKKEEMYAIAKTNYMVGVLEERSQWYKKINEKYKELTQEEKDTDGIVMNTNEKKILKELIGKEE